MAQENMDNRNDELELFSYDPVVVVWDVLRRWYLILTVAVLVGMAAFTATEVTYQPQYTAETTFVVNTKGDGTTVYQNLSATTNLAAVFSKVLNSSIMRQTILEELDLSFNGSIQAGAVPETNLLTVQVTDSSPRTAFLVMKTIIEKHSVVSYQVMGDTILDVLQEPVVPMAPSNPMNAAGNMKKAAVLSAAAMCLLLSVFSFLRDTVRSKQEAEQKLDDRVIAELHHERKIKNLNMLLHREKTSILITDPGTSFSFVEKVRKLRRQVEQRMPEGGRVVMVTSVLENEGKSTVAVNLALSLAQKHSRVLLIDSDLRRPACFKILEQPRTGTGTADVILGKKKLDSTVVSCQKMKGLDLLLEVRSLMDSTDLVSSDGMARLLAEAKSFYDYVVVDTPPMSVAPDAEGLAELVDASVLVIRQNTATASMLNEGLDVLHLAGSKVLGCVLNNEYTSILPEMGGGYGYGYGSRYGYGHYGNYGHYGKYGAYNQPHGAGSKVGNKHEE